MQKNLKKCETNFRFFRQYSAILVEGVLPFPVLYQVLEITAGISAYGICGEE